MRFRSFPSPCVSFINKNSLFVWNVYLFSLNVSFRVFGNLLVFVFCDLLNGLFLIACLLIEILSKGRFKVDILIFLG